MGMSADAYLFYGYVWEDEREDLTDDDYEASEKGKEDHGVEIGWHCHLDYSRTHQCYGQPARSKSSTVASHARKSGKTSRRTWGRQGLDREPLPHPWLGRVCRSPS